MSIDEIRERLGLLPFDDFAKSKNYGRGCGRTTRAACAALAAISEGRAAAVMIPDDNPHLRIFVRSVCRHLARHLDLKEPEVLSYNEGLRALRGRQVDVFGCDAAWWH